MADPTTTVPHGEYKEFTHDIIAPVKNSVTLVIGAFASIESGRAKFSADGDAATIIPAGIVTNSASGDDEAALTGDSSGTVKVKIRGDLILPYNVTGATGEGDVGDFVYASDGQTLTLTAGSNNHPAGIIKKYNSGTNCDIHFFSYAQSLIAKGA